jgi:hypothetical protein
MVTLLRQVSPYLYCYVDVSLPKQSEVAMTAMRRRESGAAMAVIPLAARGERTTFSGGGATIGLDGRLRPFYASIGHPSPDQ